MVTLRILLSASLLMLAWPLEAGLAQETLPSIDPDSAEIVAELPKDERLDSLFETLRSETDAAAADEVENAILALWLESGSDTVDLLMDWALTAIEAKQYPRALDFLDRIIVMQPGYVEGWNKRATVYFLMDDYGKSIADIGRVLELEPRHFGALSGLGIMMRSLGDDTRAAAAFREALAVDPHLENVRQELEAMEAETAGRET